jgi:hypothetical protein
MKDIWIGAGRAAKTSLRAPRVYPLRLTRMWMPSAMMRRTSFSAPQPLASWKTGLSRSICCRCADPSLAVVA